MWPVCSTEDSTSSCTCCEKVISLVNGLATPSYSVLEASSVPACVSTDFLSFCCWPRRHCRGELEYGLRRDPFLGDWECHCCKGFPTGWGGDETSSSTSAFLTTWWKSIETQNMSCFAKNNVYWFLRSNLDGIWCILRERERPLSHLGVKTKLRSSIWSHPGGSRFNSKVALVPHDQWAIWVFGFWIISSFIA